jgi:hypothetical protein
MHSKQAKSIEHRATTFNLPTRGGGMGGGGLCSVFFITLSVILLLLFAPCHLLSAEIRDRVVAFVGNNAITLSELEVKYEETLKITPDITRDEVLNTMINRLLLVEEAKKIKLEAPSEDELLRNYIDLRIRAFIRIKEEEIKDFYKKHIDEFQGKEFDAVRDEIENYLTEKALNERLKIYINELREKACIKIQLNRDFETKKDGGD